MVCEEMVNNWQYVSVQSPDSLFITFSWLDPWKEVFQPVRLSTGNRLGSFNKHRPEIFWSSFGDMPMCGFPCWFINCWWQPSPAHQLLWIIKLADISCFSKNWWPNDKPNTRNAHKYLDISICTMGHGWKIQIFLNRFHVPDIFNEIPVVLVPIVFEENETRSWCRAEIFFDYLQE